MAGPDTELKSILIIGHQWPEPEATGAGVRMLWLLEAFGSAGYKIVFACVSDPGEYGADLGRLGVTTIKIRLNDTSFDQMLQKSDFSHVLFDRFLTEEQFGWRVRDNLPEALLLLDTEDLHSLRYSREEVVLRGGEWSVADWVEHPMFYRELASMFRADLSLIISKAEMQLLCAEVPYLEEKLIYLPFGMSKQPEASCLSFQQRRGFVFVGNGKHAPNLDAIAQLKTEIWPLIRKKLPEAILEIYGAYLPNTVFQMHAPTEGFLVKGWTPELHPVLGEARLLLVPVRFGAGIKGKILRAAQLGLPAMATKIGFEGILEEGNSYPFSTDSTGDFAEKAVDLYTNPAKWNQALKFQQDAAGAHYDTTFDVLTHAIQSYPDRREALPRESRVIQNLLQNEAFGRLRYLSRWIEAKEKGGN